MKSCCCCCNSDDEDSTFQSIDDILVKFMKEQNNYKEPNCKRVCYEIQWDQIQVTSEVVEYKLFPHNKTLHNISQNLNNFRMEDDNKSNDENKACKVNELEDANYQSKKQQSMEGNNEKKSADHDETEKKIVMHQLVLDPGDNKGQEAKNVVVDKGGCDIKKPDTDTEIKDTTITTNLADVDKIDDSDDDPTKHLMETKMQSSDIDSCDAFDETGKGDASNKSDDDGQKQLSATNADKKTTKSQKFKSAVASVARKIRNTEKKNIDTGIEIKPMQDLSSDINHKKLKKEDLLFSEKMCLFKTEYTNTSGNPQNFTFQTDRSTSSSVAITVQKSKTIGGKIALGIKIPIADAAGIDPLNVTGELAGEIQWSESETKSITSTMNWNVNNVVKVEHNQKVTAELNVVEEEAFAKFKVKYTMTPIRSALTDDIQVYVFAKSEMKKEPRKRKVLEHRAIPKKGVNGFCAAFKTHKRDFEIDERQNKVTFYVEGLSKCIYQAKQIINVQTEDLNRNASIAVQTEDGLLDKSK